jgi:type II secretory pathway pseudopilin PulG
MKLRGQHGYAMTVLLVALSVMAVLLTVVLPVWTQAAKREKEAELIFRGQQYVHAIALFQRKSGPGVFPPNVDVLVDQKFLRRKYKDPITGGDFQLLPFVQAGTAAPGQIAGQQGRGGQPAPARGANPPATPPAGGVAGGVAGVASKSTDESIRVYNGRTHYNEWEFRFQPAAPAAGAGGRGGQAPGPGRGQLQQPQQQLEGAAGGRGPARGNPPARGGPTRGRQ